MTRIEGQPILTAAEMRAAEDAVIAGGVTVETLMDRAGTAIAHAVRRLAGVNEVLILCGPGNNGGDGYVAARMLAEIGVAVRVAALSEPKTAAAKSARAGWSGPIETLVEAKPAPILVDALFGTGLTRPLDADPAPTPSSSPADAGAQLNSKGSPNGLLWAPASAGERFGRDASSRRRPGPNWHGGGNGGTSSVGDVPQLGPGLRRGGAVVGGVRVACDWLTSRVRTTCKRHVAGVRTKCPKVRSVAGEVDQGGGLDAVRA